jgi:hypothetical protein
VQGDLDQDSDKSKSGAVAEREPPGHGEQANAEQQRQHTASWWQIGMNFLVPFCVSGYSAARHELRSRGGVTG